MSRTLIILFALAFACLSCEGKEDKAVQPKEETEHAGEEDVFEGDIKMPPGSKGSDRNMVSDLSRRWPKVGRNVNVPYTFHSNVDSNTKSMALQAMKEYEKNTCIRWVPRSSQQDYVEIFRDSGCYAYPGKIGGKQPLSLGEGCAYQKGTPIHEMMHTMGFMHEQSRSDRDRYITIQEQNMYSGTESQFEICSDCTLPEYPYDYGSVMHYGATAFSKNRQDTIVPKKSGVTIGQRSGFSDLDIKKLNRMYSC